ASLDGESFVEVGRKEMHEQKTRLASLIFEERRIDKDALLAYLSDLFSSRQASATLENLRTQLADFGDSLRKRQIQTRDVTYAIHGILNGTNLLEEDGRAALREIIKNKTILQELTSVLNMRLAGLEFWSWPETGLVVNMRRHMNGKYRRVFLVTTFTDPDITDALLLHYLGVSWQVQLKSSFKTLSSGKAWKQPYPKLSAAERMRRYRHLGINESTDSITSAQAVLRDALFLTQLANTPQDISGYDDEDDGQNSEAVDDGFQVNSGAAIKQKLLHLLTTESSLNTALYGRHTVVCSDFEWFGPSLPHTSILTVLEFLGISKEWLKFFETFLQAPICFKDDAMGEPRTRRCGTPISYTLSVVCGEAILFLMDFAVNQKAEGLFLYRMHDDLWLWDEDPQKCAVAWKEMNKYAKLIGLTLNRAKTGSVCVGTEQHDDLPTGPVRWGFLDFNRTRGRFIINEEEVDKHIIELRHQLSRTESVFGWVNVYNKYIGFMMRNFGCPPAVCLGPGHIEDLINILQKIHSGLVTGLISGPIAHVASLIKQRHGIDGLPEGYFYFPISRGGLGLKNSAIDLFSVQQTTETYKEGFTRELEEDQERYIEAKEHWEAGYGFIGSKIKRTKDLQEPFISFKEYQSVRMLGLQHWYNRYQKMFQKLQPVEIGELPSMKSAVDTMGWHWAYMDWYNKWIVSLYGEDIIANFGSMEIVDPTFIPVGMLEVFKTSQLKLDQ
ncbi:hypothetical protein M422DRAFT_195338, partial [Sphaerobolus stellatus SS14]